MNIRIHLAMCAALVFLTGAQAAELTESAIESTTSVMHLPDTTPQSIAVRSCAACAVKELLVTEDTLFFVGKSPVTLDTLRKSAQINAGIYVFYDARTNVVTRIKLNAVLDPSSVSTTPSTKRRGN